MTVSDLGLLFRREPFFRPLTVWTVVIGYVVTALTLFLIADGKRTVLIEPAVPEFHWFMIGVGAVVGACLAPVIWDAWTMGITSERRTPEGFFAVVQLVALVVAAGFAGDFVADLLIEKAAFFGLNAPERRATFVVVEYHSALRRSDWLDVKGPSGELFSISCGFRRCLGVSTGKRLELTVQTGRNGVQRALIPNHLRDQLVSG